MDASPPPEPSSPTPPPQPAKSSELPRGWWIGLVGVLVGLLGLGAAFWALQSQDRTEVSPPVPVVESGTPTSPAVTSTPSASETLDNTGGHSTLLEFEVPTGFPPPQLQSLSFADAFAQAAAYRGWQCQQTEVVLFSSAQQALPAVQERLLDLGYQVEDTDTALGEDRSWLARHPNRPDLFGSFSSGEEGRGNISVCALPN